MSSKNEKLFGTYIDRNYRLIRLSFLQAFKKANIDLTTEQWVLIDLLNDENGLSQNELALRSFRDAPTVSRIIDLLCKKGYTKRQRAIDDKRRHNIFLTEKGIIIYNKILPTVHQLRQKGWGGLSDEDYDVFLKIMDQIFQNFEETPTKS